MARPGSEERIAELERRVAAGELLWHPNDRVLLFGTKEDER